jgi:hypothetical protein
MKMETEKVKFEVTLVPHGFEADIFVNDEKEEYGHITRDFCSDHDPSVSAAVLIQEFCRFMGAFKTAYDKPNAAKHDDNVISVHYDNIVLEVYIRPSRGIAYYTLARNGKLKAGVSAVRAYEINDVLYNLGLRKDNND